MGNEQTNLTFFREDTGKTLLARIQNPSGTVATQASITTIALTVKNQDGTTTISSTGLTISSVIFDTIQGSSLSDARWTVDTTGYNFRHEVDSTAFPDPGYATVEYYVTPLSGEPFSLVWAGPVLPTIGS